MAEDINYEIIEALSQIARERNLKREIVLESLEIGLLTAAKRALGTLEPVDIDVDKETGTISIGIVKEVVETEEEIEEPLLQISLEKAQEVDPETEVGWHIYVDVPVTAFGRIAIQAAKQVLQQRIREAERDKIFEEYLDREGEIITGSVQQVTRGTLLVNIGRVEAILPYREQIRRERFRQGDTIKALVKEVSMSAKGPSIILSRAAEEFVRKLFAIEVPEIYEGIVEIKKIARSPGERCKVAVRSHDLRVDAVGACVGMKGSRVQSIVRELNNERIDIVPWSPDVTFFVTKAIGPAKVNRVLIDEERRELTLIMPEDQIALALGPGGTNARLAGELTGYNIDVVSEAEYERAVKEVEGVFQRVTELDITEHQAEMLRAGGVEYVQDLATFTPEELLAIPGMGPATFENILEAYEAFTGTPYSPPEREEEEDEETEEAGASTASPFAAVKAGPGDVPADGLDESRWLIDTDLLKSVERAGPAEAAEPAADTEAEPAEAAEPAADVETGPAEAAEPAADVEVEPAEAAEPAADVENEPEDVPVAPAEDAVAGDEAEDAPVEPVEQDTEEAPGEPVETAAETSGAVGEPTSAEEESGELPA